MDAFSRWQPDVVFHAAAHKHVPILETHVVEAVTTNVLGTRNVLDAATAVGTERFVLRLDGQGRPPVQRHGCHQASGRASVA